MLELKQYHFFFLLGIFQSYIYNHINFWTNSSIHNIFIQILNIHFRKWSCHLKRDQLRNGTCSIFSLSTIHFSRLFDVRFRDFLARGGLATSTSRLFVSNCMKASGWLLLLSKVSEGIRAGANMLDWYDYTMLLYLYDIYIFILLVEWYLT